MRTIDGIIEAIQLGDVSQFETFLPKLLKLKLGVMTRCFNVERPLEENGLTVYQAIAYYNKPQFLSYLHQHPYDYALPKLTKSQLNKTKTFAEIGPLHIAAMKGKGHDKLLKALLQHPSFEDVEEARLSGQLQINGLKVGAFTPLWAAAFYGNLDVVKFLLSHHAKIDAVPKETLHGDPYQTAQLSPLAVALIQSHESVVLYLIEKGAKMPISPLARLALVEQIISGKVAYDEDKKTLFLTRGKKPTQASKQEQAMQLLLEIDEDQEILFDLNVLLQQGLEPNIVGSGKERDTNYVKLTPESMIKILQIMKRVTQELSFTRKSDISPKPHQKPTSPRHPGKLASGQKPDRRLSSKTKSVVIKHDFKKAKPKQKK